ncbi:hypothetical protein KEM52_000931 [Ascosphaera acerosa]|nr:hypothetical protein KEM52_000931 [Ascosphaera acerosa]
MVCSKCQKKLQKTALATPDVKRKNDVYLSGSGFGNVGGAGAKEKDKRASGPAGAGISKNKLLSAKAKNPFAAYASSCQSCKTKCESGRKFCQRCAYRDHGELNLVCAVCGKNLAADAKGKKFAPVVHGQKFTAK